MRFHTRFVAGAAALVALAGCSSSTAPGRSSAPGHSSVPATTSPPSSPATSPSSTAATGAPADAATKQAVSRAYATFFDAKTPLGKSEAVLQHGPAFRAALIAEGKSDQAQGASARVTAVNRVSPKVAYVTYTIESGGSPLLPGAHGYAVREHGRWQVAAKTFCQLLQLEGSPAGACRDPSITALPH